MISNPLQKQDEKGLQSSWLIKSIKNVFIKEKAAPADALDENHELIECINKAKKDWANANMCFESAEEEGAIDYYIYSIKAYEVKYQHLLKKAKEKGIKVSFADLPNSLYSESNSDNNCKA